MFIVTGPKFYIVYFLHESFWKFSLVHLQSMCYSDENNQQDATNFSFINLFKSAQHVSGDKFAHPQEHFLTIYSVWYNAPTLLPMGDTVEMELSPISTV